MAQFQHRPDGFPNRIELSETDTIAEDYYNIITGATQYSAVYHSDEVDVDIDRDAFDAVPDSAEVTGKLTVGKAQTQTLTLPILIQPWKPAGSDAVYFAWKLGRDTGSKGTLNAQVLWLGESGRLFLMIVLAASFSQITSRMISANRNTGSENSDFHRDTNFDLTTRCCSRYGLN